MKKGAGRAVCVGPKALSLDESKTDERWRETDKGRETDDRTIQQPSITQLLLYLFQDSRKEEEEEKRKEVVCNRVEKPEPGFLFESKYVGGVGQSITLSLSVPRGFSRL